MKDIININSCNFKYSSNNQTIIDIDLLSIKSEEHIFLRGKSGSGKSTFLKSFNWCIRTTKCKK